MAEPPGARDNARAFGSAGGGGGEVTALDSSARQRIEIRRNTDASVEAR